MHSRLFLPSRKLFHARPSSISAQLARRDVRLSSTTSTSWRSNTYLPHVYDYLLWTILGSEALHLLWLKMEYAEYREKNEMRIGVLKNMVDTLERGERLKDDVEERVKDALGDEEEFEKRKALLFFRFLDVEEGKKKREIKLSALTI